MSLKKNEWENADEEVVRSCNRNERGICTKKGENVSIVERGEKRGA